MSHRIECARAEEFISSLPDGSVNLIVTDPPYHRVKDEAWDRQWDSDDDFLAWVDGCCREWRRVLAPNGSLYVFASPQMSWGVEGVVRKHFDVLSSIVWAKPDPNSELNRGGSRSGQASKESLRSWFPSQERVVFAETKETETDYARADAHESIRSYLDGARSSSGLSRSDVDRLLGCQMSGHWFSRCQWELPTRENYEKLTSLLGLRRSFDDVRAEYDEQDADYQLSRRPFSVSAEVPYTDVWTYPTVPFYEGKHPCEKPADMARDIILASSRPGDVVADFFCGSGPFLAAAAANGRTAWGCDMDPHWHAVASERVASSAFSCKVVPAKRVPRPGKPPRAAKPGRASLGSTTMPLPFLGTLPP